MNTTLILTLYIYVNIDLASGGWVFKGHDDTKKDQKAMDLFIEDECEASDDDVCNEETELKRIEKEEKLKHGDFITKKVFDNDGDTQKKKVQKRPARKLETTTGNGRGRSEKD